MHVSTCMANLGISPPRFIEKTGVPYPFSPVRCRLAPMYYTSYMLIYCRLSSRILVEQVVHAREYVHGQPWYVAPVLKKQGFRTRFLQCGVDLLRGIIPLTCIYTVDYSTVV